MNRGLKYFVSMNFFLKKIMMVRLIYSKAKTKQSMLHHLVLAYFVIAREGLSLTNLTAKLIFSRYFKT